MTASSERGCCKADARTRTADPFITRTPRRLWPVAVLAAEGPGQANFGRFAPERFAVGAGWCVATLLPPSRRNGLGWPVADALASGLARARNPVEQGSSGSFGGYRRVTKMLRTRPCTRTDPRISSRTSGERGFQAAGEKRSHGCGRSERAAQVRRAPQRLRGANACATSAHWRPAARTPEGAATRGPLGRAGGEGEARAAAPLEKCVHQGVVLMHGRAIPGTRANGVTSWSAHAPRPPALAARWPPGAPHRSATRL